MSAVKHTGYHLQDAVEGPQATEPPVGVAQAKAHIDYSRGCKTTCRMHNVERRLQFCRRS